MVRGQGNAGNPNPSPATRWQPGTSPNPGGRPKGESFTSVLRELLDKEHRRAPNWRAAVAAKAIDMASKGDLDAIKWIADRTDGRVTEKVETSGETRHIVEVRRSRRDPHDPGPAGPTPRPAADQG